MVMPGNPGYSVPMDGLTQIVRRIEDLERSLRELRPQTVSTGTIQAPSFNGNVAAGNPGTAGYGLDGPSGNAAFGGNIAIGGTLNVTGSTTIAGSLVLPNASVNNAALVSPVSVSVADANVTGLSMPTTITALVSTTVTVPSGFSKALVMAVAAVGATSGASGGFMDGRVTIAGTAGAQLAVSAAGPSLGCSVTASSAQTLTGLIGGGTFVITGDGSASIAGWTGGNAHVSASILWLR